MVKVLDMLKEGGENIVQVVFMRDTKAHIPLKTAFAVAT